MFVSVEALTGEGLHGQIIHFRETVEDEGLLNGCLGEKTGRKVLLNLFSYLFLYLLLIKQFILTEKNLLTKILLTKVTLKNTSDAV